VQQAEDRGHELLDEAGMIEHVDAGAGTHGATVLHAGASRTHRRVADLGRQPVRDPRALLLRVVSSRASITRLTSL
jgi:hypothetical protein